MSHHNWIFISCVILMIAIACQSVRYVDELPRWQRILCAVLPIIAFIAQATAIISTAH